MMRFFSIAGGLIGWKLGALAGFWTVYFACVLASAGGLILGRRVSENLLKWTPFWPFEFPRSNAPRAAEFVVALIGGSATFVFGSTRSLEEPSWRMS
jgi:hypothetical protein